MKRVLLKLSGEALAGDKKTGFDEATCVGVAKQVKKLVDDGIQVAIVTGGGNFWRGRTSETIDRVKADQIGMLATVMNCIYVSDIFRYVGMETEMFHTICMWCIYITIFQRCSSRSTRMKERLYSLQAVQDIRISQQIQELFSVRSRSRQMQCFWQRQLTEFMTAIRR